MYNTRNYTRKYCYVFTFLKTFKYDFDNCKQSKNKYVFSFYIFLLYALFMCPTVSNLYNNNYNNNCLFNILLTQLFVILVTTEIFKPQLHTMLTEFLCRLLCLSRMLVVVSLFGTCSMYLLMCICVLYIVYTLLLVAFAFSISFIHMTFVLVTFIYCFYGK